MSIEKEISTNLLAAGLFDVAYRVDSAQGNAMNTVLELLLFCMAAVGDPELIEDWIEGTFDPSCVTGAQALARATMMMGHIDAQIDSERARGLTDVGALTTGVGRLIVMQRGRGDSKSKRMVLNRIRAACTGLEATR